MLIAEGTRDEGPPLPQSEGSSDDEVDSRYEESTHRGPINFDLTSSFSVSDDGATQGVLSFVEDEREANKKQLSDVEDTPMEIKQGEAKETTRLEPSSYRPSWQSGLEDF